MTLSPVIPKKQSKIIYPETDGKPMAENTKQFRWIVTIKEGLEAMFAADPNVFVAGDLLWYPVEGRPDICAAPDTMVVFGRPKGDRGSYLQWEEENIPPQVVFEILSPGNTLAEMTRKYRFYEKYGVEEYYVYDPDRGELSGWQQRGATLEEIEKMIGWVSPRLGIRFEIEDLELALYRPDGERFLTYTELAEARDAARQQAEAARQQAVLAGQRAADAEARTQRLIEQLRALGVEPELE